MTIFDTDINIKNNVFIFNVTNTNGIDVSISDYKQPEATDINLYTDELPIINDVKQPDTMLYVKNLVVFSNINIHSNKQYSYIVNNNDVFIKSNLNLNDEKSSKLTVFNEIKAHNFFVNNTKYTHNVLDDITVKGFQYNSNITNNIVSTNSSYSYNNIIVKNNFSTPFIQYNNIIIHNNLDISNNLNINYNIINNQTNSYNAQYNNLLIEDSAKINSIILPNINLKYNRSISYNIDRNTILFHNNITSTFWDRKGLHILYNTGFVQQYPYINIIQNNNIAFNINDVSKNISIYNNNINISNNVTITDLYIKNNDICTIENDLIVNSNLYITTNKIFTISSNKSYTNLKDGSIRFNNKLNIYEKYIDNIWTLLLDISNANRTSYLQLHNENSDIVNTILYNSNNQILLNTNVNDTIFSSKNHYISNNLNIFENCNIKNCYANNLNLQHTLITNSIKQNNNIVFHGNNIDNSIYYTLYNTTVSNDIKINKQKKIYNDSCNVVQSDIHNTFSFFISKIFTNYTKCDTNHTNIEPSSLLNNYHISLTNYKIYNNISIDKCVLYLNKIIDTSLDIKINDTTFTIDFTKDIYKGKLDVLLTLPNTISVNKNEFISMEIRTDLFIQNLSANINIICKNVSAIGKIYPNNSIVYIDKNIPFEIENRRFYGNIDIKNNLNFYNININNTLFLTKNLFIKSNISDQNAIANNSTLNKDILFNISNNINKSIFTYYNNNIGFFNINPSHILTIDSNINSTDIYSGSISIDKNFTNTGDIYIKGNTTCLEDINISNTLSIPNNNIYHNISASNYTCLRNINITSNLNVKSNLNVLNDFISDYIIINRTTSSYYSNMKHLDNKLQFYYNKNWNPIIEFPTVDNTNNIYLLDTNDIQFKYNNKNILSITKTGIKTHDFDNNTTNILSIASNFNITQNNIYINSKTVKVNDTNILDDLLLLENKYYCPYNINMNSLNNYTYNISYNGPILYNNLKTFDTKVNKNLEYIAYQLCLGNINSHFHPNWNNNSLIYYRNYNSIQFNANHNYINHIFTVPTDTSSYLNNIKFDFITTSHHTYNINTNSDKIQYVYNTYGQPLEFFNNPTNISLRIIPIYNIRDPTYIYYSNIVNL